MKRIVYKSRPKRLFDLGGGICYLEMRGSIYFLASTKYDSMSMLRKAMNYENKTPIEFYEIVHNNYLFWCERTRQINEKKQSYYKQRRLIRKQEKLEKLKAEIKELENDM